MDFKVVNQKLPLWYQITQSRRAEIPARAPDAPTRLPTEAGIAGQYGVSIITVRQALKASEEEGLICRHRRLRALKRPQPPPRRDPAASGTWPCGRGRPC